MSVAEDDSEDHHHHLPAVEDWPHGFGEASWWPFITAIGVAGVYLAAALYVLGHGESSVVGSNVGPLAFIASTVVFLVGLYGWVYHDFVKAYWEGGEGESTGLRWGMILFLGSEIATFSAGFVYYFFLRTGAWPPQELPHLINSLVLANTGILVLSSITLHFAHVALHEGKRRRFIGLLGATLLLGIVFIGGQALEYYEFIVHEGFTLTEGVFGSAFYGLTGLHGLHVTLGAVLIAIVFARALVGQYNAERDTSISTVAMYWHFVDAVWIFLVVVIYVGSEVSF
ncbi:MAG: heme-copper oxidase subunit III [Halobacteriaceae archaeon]